jgi:hypothetical protein
MKKSTLQEDVGYRLAQQEITRIETELTTVNTTISSLPTTYASARQTEYVERDKLKAELQAANAKLLTISPSTHQDITVIGNFIARFILDIVIFALFEVLAAGYLCTRAGKRA